MIILVFMVWGETKTEGLKLSIVHPKIDGPLDHGKCLLRAVHSKLDPDKYFPPEI